MKQTHNLVPLRISSLFILGAFEDSWSEVREGNLRWLGGFLEDGSSTRDDERTLLSAALPNLECTEFGALEPMLGCLSSCSFLGKNEAEQSKEWQWRGKKKKRQKDFLTEYHCNLYKSLSHHWYTERRWLPSYCLFIIAKHLLHNMNYTAFWTWQYQHLLYFFHCGNVPLLERFCLNCHHTI